MAESHDQMKKETVPSPQQLVGKAKWHPYMDFLEVEIV